MSVSLVQSNAGGFGTTTTSAVGFNSNTTAGNLLVCVVWASASSLRGAAIETPVTSGFTWTLATSATFSDVGTAHGASSIYYIADAASMSTSVTTTVTSSVTLDRIEFSLYEFSGVLTTSPIDTSVFNDSVSGGIPETSSLSTSAEDLIIVSMTGVGSNGSAGSGYTLGINASEQFTGCIGQTQYILNQAAGSVATAFATSQTYWGCCAVAFKSSSVSVSLSGVSASFAVNSPSVEAGSSASPSGVAADFAVGTALAGGAVAFAEPSGVSARFSVGVASAGIPINYGNAVSGSSGLPPGVNSTYFYVRWTGWLMVDTPGKYTLGLNIGDGGDFYIGTQPVVLSLGASQSANSTTEYTQSSIVELAINIAYPIVIEWQHGGGASYECQLLWTPPGATTEVIPATNLSLSGKWWNGTSSQWYPNTWY